VGAPPCAGPVCPVAVVGRNSKLTIDMSRQMVDHYMRFKDQMDIAAEGRARLQLVERPQIYGAHPTGFVKPATRICKTAYKVA